jgi:hypothetical protein
VEHFQRRAIRRDDEAPCPPPLPEKVEKDGDALIVWKFDRRASSLRDFIAMV